MKNPSQDSRPQTKI